MIKDRIEDRNGFASEVLLPRQKKPHAPTINIKNVVLVLIIKSHSTN